MVAFITFLTFFEFIALLVFIFLELCFLASFSYGIFYAPTKIETVETIINLTEIKSGLKAADLGSGDGRIVIALAQAGAEVHGYEINPFLVWLARRKIKKEKLSDKAFIHRKDFWHQDFSSFDIVVIYGIPKIMERLEEKLKREMKPNAKIISNSFVFPSWQYSQKIDGVYLYEQN